MVIVRTLQLNRRADGPNFGPRHVESIEIQDRTPMVLNTRDPEERYDWKQHATDWRGARAALVLAGVIIVVAFLV
jgi:hypothetical protein